jgi:hypothetical protein
VGSAGAAGAVGGRSWTSSARDSDTVSQTVRRSDRRTGTQNNT